MKAMAKIGNSEWETATWFDTNHKTHILPIKAEIRNKEINEPNKVIITFVWIQAKQLKWTKLKLTFNSFLTTFRKF